MGPPSPEGPQPVRHVQNRVGRRVLAPAPKKMRGVTRRPGFQHDFGHGATMAAEPLRSRAMVIDAWRPDPAALPPTHFRTRRCPVCMCSQRLATNTILDMAMPVSRCFQRSAANTVSDMTGTATRLRPGAPQPTRFRTSWRPPRPERQRCLAMPAEVWRDSAAGSAPDGPVAGARRAHGCCGTGSSGSLPECGRDPSCCGRGRPAGRRGRRRGSPSSCPRSARARGHRRRCTSGQ